MRVHRNLHFLPLLAATIAMHGQQGMAGQALAQANAAPTGNVTGTVLSQDTQRPVRFAQVQLQSVSSVSGDEGGGRFGSGGGGAARSEVDGTFTATNLAAGDYYVSASAVGFIPERALLAAAVRNGSDPAQLLAGLPRVHVDAGETSSVTVTLQRGGTIGGRMVWEDGSAAAGIAVSATSVTAQAAAQLPAPLQGLQLNGGGIFAVQTDDRGDFRIAGLPSDDYQVQATIQSRQQGGGFRGGQALPSTLRVYAPGVFRRSAAKAYSVRAGDERTDVRMVLDLHGLRTVSGHVGSTNSGQAVASGRVSVTDPGDTSLTLQGAIGADGSFTIRYVPPGNYTLSVIGASTRSYSNTRGRGGDDNNSSTPVVSFQTFSQPIVVTDTDLTGFTATLTPVQAK